MLMRAAFLMVIILSVACSGDSLEAEKRTAAQQHYRTTNTVIPSNNQIISFTKPSFSEAERPKTNPDRNAFFGDLHVHTALSFDASAFGTTASPSDAYRYAQGEAIAHPSGFEVQLTQPLDFYAVTDHGVLLGLINEAIDTNSAFSQYELAKPYHNINESIDGGLLDLAKRSKAFYNFVSDVVANLLDGTIDEDSINNASKSSKPLTPPTSRGYSPPLQPTNSPHRPKRAKHFIAMSSSVQHTAYPHNRSPALIALTPKACGIGWISYDSKT